MPNLANAPTYRLTERRAILERVYHELLEDEDFTAVLPAQPRIEQAANWEAREFVVKCMEGLPLREEIEPKVESTPA